MEFFLTLLGGLLAVLGGVGGSVVLGRIEHERESERQRRRHATAVRIVVLEMQANSVALTMHAGGSTGVRPSRASHDAVATDLYSLLPNELASEVVVAYFMAVSLPPQQPTAQPLASQIDSYRKNLQTYAEDKLGLTFAPASKINSAMEAAVKAEDAAGTGPAKGPT